MNTSVLTISSSTAALAAAPQPPSPKAMALAATLTLAIVPVAAMAIDSIPLDQLKPGLWRVERKIEKLDLSPVEHETRNSEYCASPKKEITRTLRAATFLCKSEVSRLTDNQYRIHARCNLGAVSGENTTLITIVSPDEYRAEVDTQGSVLGKQQHRKESITAVRAGDCQAQ